MNLKRVKAYQKIEYKSGTTLYWMSRDQRVDDNWALLHAQELAEKYDTEFQVVFCLRKNLEKSRGTARMLDFMIEGLKEVEQSFSAKNIKFEFLVGNPEIEIPEYINKHKIGYLVCDFSPLKINKKWYKQIRDTTNIPIDIVDTHNIVPVWEASEKQEYAAQFFRKKINSKLDEFLVEFPNLSSQNNNIINQTNWQKIRKSIKVNEQIKLPQIVQSGSSEAKSVLNNFIKNKLNNYAQHRNDSNKDVLSNLSPYLHFGQISAQRVAQEIKKQKQDQNTENFLEELIVRRELSDNFCYYNSNYDNWQGLPEWGRNTLEKHTKDRREYVYSFRELEEAKTHDQLWNAAQKQMTREGKIHGYMRMYWAKKLLEWTNTPKTAIIFANKLNDLYEIDGRDPNGYVGVLWSIGGLHDRPWFERDIYGTVRYMNKNGASKKFDVKEYIRSYS